MTDNVKKKTCKDCKYFGHPLWGRFYCRARGKEFYTISIVPCWKFKLQNVFEEQEESEEPLDYVKINSHCTGDFNFTVRGTDVVNFLRDYLDQEISYNLTRLEVLTEQLF